MMINPLLGKFNTPFDTIPFQKILPEHFGQAFEIAFEEAYSDIRAIEEDDAPANFENTLLRLEESGERLGRLSAILFNLNHAETNEAIQKLASEMAPRLTAFSNDITLNPVLFRKVESLMQPEIISALNPEQEMLLRKTHRNFIRSGANLQDDKKEELRKISGRLAELSVKFGENILAETNDFYLHLTEQEDLAGLPGHVKQSAASLARSKGKEGWGFNLQFPSYVPFMKYSENRQLRETMYRAYGTRCLHGNAHDNRELVREIVNLRLRLARLLGFDTYAAYVLDNRMAETTEKVHDLLDKLKTAYLPAAHAEAGEAGRFADEEDKLETLMPWDWAFYAEKLRDRKYAVNDELIRPYFELGQCVGHVFRLASQLYGISFTERKDLEPYHPDVEVWEVLDEKNDHLAVLYMDYFPREGKKPGAWMTGYLQQHKTKGKNIRPHVSLVFNFPKTVEETPSLLNYGELRTLLHEFGHALHSIFSEVNYKSLSGTSVYRDFVELPSQFMENWAEQKAWLQRVGKHYKTGEVIPEVLIDNLIESKNFHEGYAGCRQISFGLLDMSWHSLREEYAGDIIGFEKKNMAELSVLPEVKETSMSPSFGHIFGGGYAAGYYGYKWSEVLDADAFSRFINEGIFNAETAREFREKILSKGGSRHPMELYTDFMGREPDINALLIRSGFPARSEH
ncbi:MAG: M3 family metallopeptidase [Bacteroidales bacterium]|nr:M3 family metallopeptidase [Bacteroidales bacterium]